MIKPRWRGDAADDDHRRRRPAVRRIERGDGGLRTSPSSRPAPKSTCRSHPTTSGTHRAQLHVGHDRQSERRRLLASGRAYTNAVSNVLVWAMPHHPVYLWTLPMFHCNGWCFPWTVAAMAGTHVCLRRFDAPTVFDAIREHQVTHYCGAPIVQAMLVNAPDETKHGIDHRVSAMVAAAAPPAAMIEGMDRLGFDFTHRLRADRGLRSGDRLLPNSRRGRSLDVGERRDAERTPGRALYARGGRRQCSTRKRCSRCPGTVKPSAR